MGCPVILSPVCGAVGGATSLAANGVISAIVGWVVTGARWLLQQLGGVIGATTAVHVRTSWFRAHYATMAGIGAVAAVPMLCMSALQAVYHQSAGVLVRAAFVNLPLAGVLTGVAVQCVQLALGATDALCATVSTGSAGLDKSLTGIATTLVRYGAGTDPTFVVVVGALLIVCGGFALWLELIVRAASVYVALLFLPLALASLTWPGVSHWCRRLVETLGALILSKFVIVAILSLAVGAMASGSGFASVLAGGAILLLAAFTPFVLLRLVPLVEVGAALQLEHARHRVAHAVTSGPTSAASFALRQARAHLGPREDPGAPGTGLTVEPGPAGPSDGRSGGGALLGVLGDTAATAGAAAGVAVGGATAGAARAEGAPGASGGAGTTGAGRMEGAGGRGGMLPLGPTPPGWLRGDLRLPSGGIPAFEGTEESARAMVEGARSSGRPEVVPDGYGGVIPGIPSPLYGGTEPFSRFEPGPTDDWGAGWEAPGGPGRTPPAPVVLWRDPEGRATWPGDSPEGGEP